MYSQDSNPDNHIVPGVPAKIFLLVAVTLSFLGAFAGSAIIFLVCESKGIDMQALTAEFSPESPPSLRYFMRGLLLINHLLTFLIPALVVAWIFYRKKWSNTLSLGSGVSLQGLILGTLFILSAFPLAQAVMGANSWLMEQSEWLKPLIDMESSSERMIEGLLVMPNFLEMLSSLVVMALVPALGEELLFRGVFQQYIGKWTGKPLLSVFVVALIFSLAHFQVQRFLAIFLLGIVLGLLFYWTRNLWISIGAHFINNAAQVIVAFSFQDKIDEINSGDFGQIQWGLVLASGFVAVYTGFLIWKKFRIPDNP